MVFITKSLIGVKNIWEKNINSFRSAKINRKTSYHHPVNSTAADGWQGGRAAFRKNGDEGIRYFDIKARFSRKYIIGY